MRLERARANILLGFGLGRDRDFDALALDERAFREMGCLLRMIQFV